MNNKNLTLILILLVLAANYLLRLPFLGVPLERDEGEYAYLSQVIAGGGVPYKDAFDQKPPGIFYLYWLLFLVFPKHTLSVRVFVIFYNLLTAYFVYKIGMRYKNRHFGLIAALIFAIVSSERRLLGFTLNTEMAMLAPMTASVYYALLHAQRGALTYLAFSGALSAIAVLFKQPAAFTFVCIAAFVIYRIWQDKTPLGRAALSVSVLGVSFAAPLFLAALYFFLRGAFGDFSYQVLFHNLRYVGWQIPKDVAMRNLTESLRFILQSQGVLWALMLAGITVSLKEKIKDFWLVLLCVAASFFAVSLGKRFTIHYFQQLMPFLALCAALGFVKSMQLFEKIKKGPRGAFSFLALLCVLVIALPAFANYGYFQHPPEELTYAVYSGSPFNEAVTVGAWLKKASNPEDRVFIAGSEPQILFYAGRASASKYIFFYPLTGGYSDSLSKQEEVVAELTARPPAYIVYANYALSLGVMPSSPRYIFEALGTMLQRYTLVGVVNPLDPGHLYAGEELRALLQKEPGIFNSERMFIYALNR